MTKTFAILFSGDIIYAQLKRYYLEEKSDINIISELEVIDTP